MTLWHIKSIIYHGYITCSASASQTLTDTEQVSRSLPTWRDGIRRCEQQAGCISTSRFQKGSWHSTWCDMCSWAELLALQMSWPRVGVWATTQNGKYSIRNERTGQEESVRMAPIHFSFQGNEHRISYFEFQSKPLQVWVIWQSLLKAVPEGNQWFWLQIKGQAHQRLVFLFRVMFYHTISFYHHMIEWICPIFLSSPLYYYSANAQGLSVDGMPMSCCMKQGALLMKCLWVEAWSMVIAGRHGPEVPKFVFMAVRFETYCHASRMAQLITLSVE